MKLAKMKGNKKYRHTFLNLTKYFLRPSSAIERRDIEKSLILRLKQLLMDQEWKLTMKLHLILVITGAKLNHRKRKLIRKKAF